jgi:hypothetical protein
MNKLLIIILLFSAHNVFASAKKLQCTGIYLVPVAGLTEESISFEEYSSLENVEYADGKVVNDEAKLEITSTNSKYPGLTYSISANVSASIKIYGNVTKNPDYDINVKVVKDGHEFYTNAKNAPVHVVSGKNNGTDEYLDVTCEIISAPN